MQTKKIIFLIFLIAITLISNTIAETQENETNYNQSKYDDSSINLSETEPVNDIPDKDMMNDKLNIDAPETVEAGKEYKIKVTDKQGNPAKDIKLDIFISESLITVTTNKEGIVSIIPNISGKIDGIFAFSIPNEEEPRGKDESIGTNKTMDDNSTEPSKPPQEPNHNNYIIIAIIVITIFVSAFVIWYKKFKK